MLSEAIVHIVDDDEAVRHALSMLMHSVELKTSVFSSARAFLDSVDPTLPGCLVLDVRMPEMSGLDLQRELAKRDIKIPIIIITGHGDVPMVVRAMKEGAVDFLEKPFHDQDLLDSIATAVAKSITILQEQDARRLFLARSRHLSSREKQVMDLLIDGCCSKEIAIALGISPKTVDVHRGHVMDKMQVKSVIELVHLAIFKKAPVEIVESVGLVSLR